MWNAYSPFREMPENHIDELGELEDLEGRATDRSD
jgi:hypothetical protein